jgi:GLPGLI family protein
MKYILNFLICIFLVHGSSVLAQNKHFITSGIIEFERTNNMFALLKKKVTTDHMDNKPYYEKYLQTEPQFIKLNSTLVFGNNTSLFTPIPYVKGIAWFYDSPMISQHDVIFSDFEHNTSTIQKEFYERTYLVKDTLRKIKWKITDETRVIAGYNCRRANGLVLDTVYTVAFYTDEIHLPGGPGSFNGLPGMILGVALPHENVSWFATKVTEGPADIKKLIAPKQGKVVNNKQLFDELWKSYGNKGEIGLYFIKGYTL